MTWVPGPQRPMVAKTSYDLSISAASVREVERRGRVCVSNAWRSFSQNVTGVFERRSTSSIACLQLLAGGLQEQMMKGVSDARTTYPVDRSGLWRVATLARGTSVGGRLGSERDPDGRP